MRIQRSDRKPVSTSTADDSPGSLEPACSLCGGALASKYRTKGTPGLAIAKCSRCGVEQLASKPGADELADVYEDDDFLSYTPGARQAIDRENPANSFPVAAIRAYDSILAFAEGIVGAPGRLLDIGCGDGSFVTWSRHRAWRVAGLEPSPGMAEQLDAELADADIRQGMLDADSRPFQGEAFDLVSMIHVLEHMDDPRRSLRYLRELVAEGGLLYVEVPNLGSIARRAVRRDWSGYRTSHLFHFNVRTLSRLLDEAGYDIVEVGSVGFNPSMWRQASSWANKSLTPASETPDDSRSRVKQLVRPALDRFCLLDSLEIWARPKAR